MSRKREKQRESRKEIHRQLGQLGVEDEEVADDLRSRARVSEPTMTEALHVLEAKRGLLRRARPLALHVALYVVDAAGPRLALLHSARGVASRVPGDVELTPAGHSAAHLDHRVRYTRPGHFVVVALVVEGGDDASFAAQAEALVDPAVLALDTGAGAAALAKIPLAPLETTRAVRPSVQAPLPAPHEALTFHAASVLAIPAVHRVQEAFDVALASTDGRLRARLTLQLRL